MDVLFEIIPSEGVVVNGKTKILVGSSIEDVSREMEEHRNLQSDNSHYFFESNLRIETAEDGSVSEIEISADSDIETSLFGVNPFEYEDAGLIELIDNRINEKPEMQGSVAASTDVVWKSNGLALWRPNSPEKVLESAEEAREDGFYEQWMKEEYEPSKFFRTVLVRKPESEG